MLDEYELKRACSRARRTSLSTHANIERLHGEHKLLAEQPLPLPATQCPQRAAAIQRNRSFSVTPMSSTGTSEETATEPGRPEFGQLSLSNLGNGVAGEDTPARAAKVNMIP